MRRFLFLAFPCALFALLACLIPGASSTSAAPVAKCSGWSVINSPSPGKALNLLNAVASISANDMWAVGYSDSPSKYVRKTLIEHWNGTQWSLIPSPNPSSSSNELNAVAAVSTNDVWAVGIYNNIPLIEHWNGTQWSLVPGLGLGLLYGVTAVSTNDVWAVGHDNNVKTLIEHWNGSTWSIVSSPNPDPYKDILQGVTAISTNDIWTVGWYIASNFSEGTITEHWNGSKWILVPSPNPDPGTIDQFESVSAVATNDVWAVGESSANGGLVEHWDGTSWKVVPSPNIIGSFTGVAVISAKNVWAVGLYTVNNFVSTLTEQWNGIHWRIVSSPNRGKFGDVLRGVTNIPGTNTLWTVGNYDPIDANSSKTLTLYHC